MVAIGILISSVASALGLVQASLTASRVSGSQVIAANLAREGLEVVRALRDGNWLKSRSFEVGLIDPAGKQARPIFDTSLSRWSLSFAPTTIDAENARVWLTESGLYLQADAPPADGGNTPYARMLTLDYVCRDDGTGEERIATGADACLGTETLIGLSVKAEVSWTTIGGARQSTVAEERLYDWR